MCLYLTQGVSQTEPTQTHFSLSRPCICVVILFTSVIGFCAQLLALLALLWVYIPFLSITSWPISYFSFLYKTCSVQSTLPELLPSSLSSCLPSVLCIQGLTFLYTPQFHFPFALVCCLSWPQLVSQILLCLLPSVLFIREGLPYRQLVITGGCTLVPACSIPTIRGPGEKAGWDYVPWGTLSWHFTRAHYYRNLT